MKKVIGVICFIAAAGVGYAGMSNEVNEELDNLDDSFNDLKGGMFKK